MPHARSLALALALMSQGTPALCSEVPSGYFNPEKGRGPRDIMLIYGQPGGWAKPDFLPYVAYLDKRRGGRPTDWFYDGWLFLFYGGAPSGATYIDGKTTKADWEHYFDSLFDPAHNIAALDACIADVERSLGPRPQPSPVILMIPYPSRAQRDFGGSGTGEDLAQPEARERCVRWAIDELRARWERAAPKHLALWGFYWMNEGIGPADEPIVAAAARHCHEVGLGLHWIPWFNAPGSAQARSLAIDFSIMQPNYAFMKIDRDPQRLIDAAHLAKEFGMGIEIEVPFDGAKTREGRNVLLDYLAFGADSLCGYMRGAAHAYYQGYRHIGELYESGRPLDNALYDALYRFAKGRFEGGVEHPSSAAPCTLSTDGGERPEPRLTDGLLVTAENQMDRAVKLPGPTARIDLDLGTARQFTEVRLHLVCPRGARLPRNVEVQGGRGDDTWQVIGESHVVNVSDVALPAGFTRIALEPLHSRFLRIRLRGEQGPFWIDELIVPAPESLTTDATYSVAHPDAGYRDPSGCALVDGLHARGGDLATRALGIGPDAPCAIEVTLARAVYLKTIRVHALSRAAAGIKWPRLLRASIAGPGESGFRSPVKLEPEEGGGDGAREFELPFPPALAERVRIEVEARPGAVAALDEIEADPPLNLALRRPYTLNPGHGEIYPDSDNRELTDGALTERGFGDGRTVGWNGVGPTVTVDLKQPRTIDGARVHLDGGGHGHVHFPRRLDLFLSIDGARWTHAGTSSAPPELTFQSGSGESRCELGWLRVECPPTGARFARLALGGPRGWVMLSEVEVSSRGTNAAAGAPYTLIPPPSPREKYGDTAGLLTDGTQTRTSFSEGRAVGWNRGQPEVIVDLQADRQIARVAAHVLGGGQAGIRFPSQVSVATSLDGRSWSRERIAEERTGEPEDANRAALGYISLQTEKVRARYVRLRFKPRGWLMLDEIEIY